MAAQPAALLVARIIGTRRRSRRRVLGARTLARSGKALAGLPARARGTVAIRGAAAAAIAATTFPGTTIRRPVAPPAIIERTLEGRTVATAILKGTAKGRTVATLTLERTTEGRTIAAPRLALLTAGVERRARPPCATRTESALGRGTGTGRGRVGRAAAKRRASRRPVVKGTLEGRSATAIRPWATLPWPTLGRAVARGPVSLRSKRGTAGPSEAWPTPWPALGWRAPRARPVAGCPTGIHAGRAPLLPRPRLPRPPSSRVAAVGPPRAGPGAVHLLPERTLVSAFGWLIHGLEAAGALMRSAWMRATIPM